VPVTRRASKRGPALEAATLTQLFEPLRRGTATRRHPGLGLYIVAEIARSHGGTAEVRSDDGETVFTVRLPRGH
jgi:signal transduction histidine kinase